VNGFIVSSEKETLFYEAIVKLIVNPELRINFGKNLNHTILENHSQKVVIEKYMEWLNQI
jgi:hypothetical protein